MGGKEQLAVGVSEDRALGLAEMCGRCLVGSAARGEGVCVSGGGGAWRLTYRSKRGSVSWSERLSS